MRQDHTITDEWDGSRIDRFVRTVLPGLPFHAVQMLLRTGRILLNGEKVRGGRRLRQGDTVTIESQEPHQGRREVKSSGPGESLEAAFGSIGREIGILHEDGDCLVINKPSGIVVQPGNRKELGSLLDLLELYRRRTVERSGGVFPYTPVHRLDMQTTGALVTAKTRIAARALSGAFSEGLVSKEYLAVVDGIPPRHGGTVPFPLKTRKGTRSRTRVDARGKESLSRYRVLGAVSGGMTLVAVSIATGRTHQIRSHMAAAGHPLAGDRYYGSSSRRGEGFLLHAWRLAFPHPRTGKAVEIEAPPPAEIARLFRAFR